MKTPVSIAVVGGGPAGATASRHLAEAGARVTLFEARAGSEKPCGGGVPSAALHEFPELADPSLKRRIVHQVRLYSPSGRMAAVPVSAGLHLFRRCELDAHLRSLAGKGGARICRTKVRRLRSSASGWEVLAEDGEHGPFDFLVGADGVQGVTRRAVAPPFGKEELTLALYAYVDRVVCTDVVLKFFGGFDGYLWIFPRADHVSIGICARHRTVEPDRLADELFDFIDRHCPEGRFPRTDLKGFFIPASDVPPVLSGEREAWALVGDAAGFTDPLTREGIAPAMRSAVIATSRFLSGRQLVTPRLTHDLNRAHRLRRRFFSTTFLEGLVRLSSGSPAIRRVLADLFEGNQSYRGLKRRLLFNAFPAGWQAGFGELRRATRTGKPTAG